MVYVLRGVVVVVVEDMVRRRVWVWVWVFVVVVMGVRMRVLRRDIRVFGSEDEEGEGLWVIIYHLAIS